MNGCMAHILWKKPVRCSECGKETDKVRMFGDRLLCPMCFLKEVEGRY